MAKKVTGRPDLVVDTFKAGTALLPYVRCHDFLRTYWTSHIVDLVQ